MGLMTGSGPLGPRPAGWWGVVASKLGLVLYLEPCAKRVRVVLGGETVVDSRGAFLLHESGHQPVYYFPPRDVRMDLLTPSDRVTRCPRKGQAAYFSVGTEEAVAWCYPEPIDSAPPELAGLIAFYFNRVDAFYEEDEPIAGHPRDPYHRIDTLSTSRHVRISLHGEVLAESTHAVALFESNLPPRWYVPREDVSAVLEPSETATVCPYKGTAGYFSVRLASGELAQDLVWFYNDPLPEAAKIAGLLCFYDERVDVELDGEAQERPESPWSHAAKPAATRG